MTDIAPISCPRASTTWSCFFLNFLLVCVVWVGVLNVAPANASLWQNNFRNTPICSFCLLHAFSRFLVYRLQTSTPPLYHWLWSSLRPHSRKFKKTLCVIRLFATLFLSRLRNDTNPIQNSTPDSARRCPVIPSSRGSGRIYAWVTSCA
jgi:hypothetical protein